jgi:N-acetylglutamate synthase-like GNAT family acetyltransferase
VSEIRYIALPSPLINMGHIYQAAKLVDDSFAAGYFKNLLNEINCAWMALDENKVVGWAAVTTENTSEKKGILRCVVVDPEYRFLGIGKTLTEKRLKYLDDCNIIVSYAWVRPDGRCMSCKNLENFGFKLLLEDVEYYKNTRNNCKYCGNTCKCVARVYIKMRIE